MEEESTVYSDHGYNPQYDPRSPQYNPKAYRTFLIKEHDRIMEAEDPEALRTWRLEPYDARLDVFSTDFDVDMVLEEARKEAEKARRWKDLTEAMSAMAEKPEEQTEAKPRDLAREQGALQTINSHISYASENELDKIFTGYYVKQLPSGNNADIISIEDVKSMKDVYNAHPGIMGFILRAAYLAYIDEEEKNDNTIKLQVTPICRELGIEYRPYDKEDRQKLKNEIRTVADRNEARMNVLASTIRPLELYYLRLNNKLYRMISIEEYDLRSDVMTIRAPAFFKMLENISSRIVKHGQFNHYFHGSVANEENTAAVELAQYLGNKLLQMGETKNVYAVKYSTLIQNNPQLKQELDAINNHGPMLEHKDKDGNVIKKTKYNRTQTYNATLKRTLETAYRIILEKSDFPAAYIDFKINGVSKWADDKSTGDRRVASKKFKIPTKTRLGDTLKITHKGKNPQYVRPERM